MQVELGALSGPLTAAHATELAALWDAAEPRERLDAATLQQDLVDDPQADPSLWLLARRRGALVAAAVGVIRAGPGGQGPVGYVQFLAVRPDVRRHGIATRLLDELERRLWGQGARAIRAFGGAPSYLWPGVDVTYTPALCLFERRGYRIDGYEFNMVAPTEPAAHAGGGPGRDLPEDIAFRRLTPDDGPAFGEWLMRQWGPNWRHEGLLALRRSPPTGFVAVREGAIVGFAVYDAVRPGWLGPMGVQPDLQARGVGTELGRLCLADMHRRGYAHAEIAWAGPRCFYARRFGAVVSRTFAVMQRRRPV